jgi:hypothetical protein
VKNCAPNPPARFSLVLAIVSLLAAFTLPARAQDITYTNRIDSITNVHGVVYNKVQVMRATQAGFVYRSSDGATTGMIHFGDLDPDTLERFGVSTNLIAAARERQKAQASALADYEKASAEAAQRQAEHDKMVADEAAAKQASLLAAGKSASGSSGAGGRSNNAAMHRKRTATPGT